MILELDNVELTFSGKSILNGIYLKAESGKITGILGSNGSGKSCLLDILFGSLKPKYKLIRLNGKPFLRPLYTSKQIKYLPQHHYIPNEVKLKTVFELYEVNWEIFVIIFPKFIIYKESTFGKLSGGEKRIIETYLILKSKTKIVLLDEPFSHLDPINISVFNELIIEEKKNKIIIITDHLYKHIIEISDSIYLIKNGSTKLIEDLKDLENYNYLKVGSLH